MVVSPKGEPTEAIPIHRSEHCQPRTGANAGLSRSGQRWPAPSSGASIVVERDSQILEAAPNLLVLDEIERLPPEAGSWGCGFRTSRRFCRPSGISPIR